MTPLKIPEEYEGGLAKLLALSEESAEALLSALSDAPPVMSTFELSSLLTSKVASVPREEMEDILDTLVSLYLTQQNHGESANEVAEGICSAMEESGKKELKLSKENRDRFKRRLV